VVSPPFPQVEVEAEVEAEAEVEVEEVAAEGYLQEHHLQVELHPFMESWEEIHQPNSMETKGKVKLFYLRLPCTEG